MSETRKLPKQLNWAIEPDCAEILADEIQEIHHGQNRKTTETVRALIRIRGEQRAFTEKYRQENPHLTHDTIISLALSEFINKP